MQVLCGDQAGKETGWGNSPLEWTGLLFFVHAQACGVDYVYLFSDVSVTVSSWFVEGCI